MERLNPFSGRTDKRKGQTASDVAQEYNTRIEEFFQYLEGRKLKALRGDGDSLQKFFGWVQEIYDDRSKAKDSAVSEHEARKAAETVIHTQKLALKENEHSIHEYLSLIDALRFDISEKEQQNIANEESYRRKLAENDQAHADDLETKAQVHASELDTERQIKTDMMVKHDAETNRLKSQLFVNVEDARAWPDDRLRLRFQELTNQIENIASPNRLKMPEHSKLQLDFDKTGFLLRVENQKAHVLLKSAIWAILSEQFFSLPFGFGVLGPNVESNMILRAFSSWHMVVSGSRGKVRDLRIFENDQHANSWRSTTFHSASTAVFNEDMASTNETARLSAANLESAISQIESLFISISQFTVVPIKTTNTDIRKVALIAREIASQFGVNEANLQLISPAPGERITIGTDYHDCYDKDKNAGKHYTVDLVKRPGLQKVGRRLDGTMDASSTRMILPCEVFVRKLKKHGSE